MIERVRSVRKECWPVMQFIFGKVMVTPTLDLAQQIAESETDNKLDAITLDGDMVSC